MQRTRLVSEIIRRHIGEFAPAERKVALALLRNNPTAGLESSSRLAVSVGVSGPTVIRFVNRLGFTTYADFQRALRHELDARATSPTALYRDHQPEDTVEALCHQTAELLAEAVRTTLKHLPGAELTTAVQLLSDPKRDVLAFGGWFSNQLAGYLISMLQELRPRTRFIQRTPNERVAAIEDAGRSTIAVVFDLRRYEEETASLARRMHEQGADVILFTDQWLSPIAEFADSVLSATIVSPSPFDTMTSTLAVVETVTAAVLAEIAHSDGAARFERFNRIADETIFKPTTTRTESE